MISITPWFAIISVAFLEPDAAYPLALDPKIFYESLHLLLLLMVPEHPWATMLVHSSLTTTKLSLTVRRAYQGIHSILLFWKVDNFTLSDELFAKALQRLVTYL